MLDVDATRLVQVISNLLQNATKLTPRGGTIRVSGQVLDSAANDPRVSIRVADSGAGIAAELLPRVFDLFIRGDRTSGESGLGIGLALVRRLVEMHGGEVVARSEGPGRGSEFEITLPSAAALVGHRPPLTPVSSRAGS